MRRWVDLFRNIGQKIYKEVSTVYGSDAAKVKLSKGAFGDITVYIDKMAEDIVINDLKNSNFKFTLLSEEAGKLDYGAGLPIIIVDPIDGSLNAKRGVPYFAFSIALSTGYTTDDIACAYVINLANKDEFYAIKSKGAFYNGHKIKNTNTNLNVASIEGIKKETDKEIVYNIYSNFYKVRQMGSVALDMCYLAIGGFDLFLHIQPSRIIDYAAAKLILEESGGDTFYYNRSRFSQKITINKTPTFFSLGNRSLINQLENISIIDEVEL